MSRGVTPEALIGLNPGSDCLLETTQIGHNIHR